MDYRVLTGLLAIFSLVGNSRAIGIDGKLDFGNSRSTSASFRGHKINQNILVPINTKVNTDVKDDFDNIGVVCVSGGCNTTKSTNNTGNSIQTDILVRVQTKVDLNESKTGQAEDTPDVPVVVGYRGSQLDTTIDEESNRSLDPQSIYIPDTAPVSAQPSYPHSFGSPSISTHHGLSADSPLSPKIHTRVDSSSSTLNRFTPSIINQYNPSVSSPLAPGVHSRLDSDNHKVSKFYPSVTSGSFYPSVTSGTFYVARADPKISGTVEPSFVSVGTTGIRNDADAKINTIEVKIPYFEPAYHNHYYGENPPPQLTWYPKKSNTYNPVEFKTVKSTWTPTVWNRKIVPHSHVSSAGGSGVQCTCKEGSNTPAVRWYPSTNAGSINDPGSQINDKLAPLNK